jgi:hypothetical protein
MPQTVSKPVPGVTGTIDERIEDKESAAEAYIDAAKKYHHDYARFK